MKPLDPNNLEVGQIVTVLRWVNRRDRSYVGDILRVMEIDLPFIVVSRKPRPEYQRRVPLDIREVELGYPSELYVKLFRPTVAAVSGKYAPEYR